MDQNLPGTSAWHQAQARRTERDQRLLDSPTCRRIAPPLGPGPGPAPLQYQNLPAHLAQQLAALPQLQPLGRHGPARAAPARARAPAPAPAPALPRQYGHLPLHLQQQLALLPAIPAPVTRGYNPLLPLAASIVCIIYLFEGMVSH